MLDLGFYGVGFRASGLGFCVWKQISAAKLQVVVDVDVDVGGGVVLVVEGVFCIHPSASSRWNLKTSLPVLLLAVLVPYLASPGSADTVAR